MEQAVLTERVRRLAAAEQRTGPRRISAGQTIASVYSEIRDAYCKVNAGTGSTLACYLDIDGTGKEVTVHFTLLGGITNLSDAHLSLVDGTPIPVRRRGVEWWCIIPMEGTVDCE